MRRAVAAHLRGVPLRHAIVLAWDGIAAYRSGKNMECLGVLRRHASAARRRIYVASRRGVPMRRADMESRRGLPA